MTHVRVNTRGTQWIFALWVAVACLPMLAYAQPLWRNALADTPIADLIWIPVLAFAWALWNLLQANQQYPDDAEIDLLLGGVAVILTGLLLVIGPVRWPQIFIYHHVGLLLWPLWALSTGWLFWGLGATRPLALPMLYFLFVWPPIFKTVADATQGVLVHWSTDSLVALSQVVHWLRPTIPSGTFLVWHGAHPVEVIVAQACSGADSLIGSAILLPLIFTMLRGAKWAIWTTAALALIGAIISNWVRLALIVGSVHWIGPAFTFQFIHPVMGFVLFFGLMLALVWLAGKLGLSLRSHAARVAWSMPGKARLVLASASSLALFVILWPLFRLPPGNFGNPLPVTTDNIEALMPSLPHLRRQQVYYANESSVLGLGSATLAMTYVTGQGAQALVEVWSSPDASALATYGFRNCLVYHGDHLSAQKSFALAPGIVATAYLVTLPPLVYGGPSSHYVDIEWADAIRGPQGVRYLRWSVAAFPTPSTLWANTLARQFARSRPTLGLQGLTAPPTRGSWPVQLASMRHTLRTLAQELYQDTAQQLSPSSRP